MSVPVEKLGIILEPTTNSFEAGGVMNPGVWQEDHAVHLFYRATDKKHKSCVGYARLNGPTDVVERWNKPIVRRAHAYESVGIEDPRIVKIGNMFYMTYVAHDGKNALIAYATSKDLKNFKKHGTISPKMVYDDAAKLFREEKLKDRYFLFEAYYEEFGGKDMLLWEKDGCLFPKKINGRFAMLHRILPDIQIVYFKKFEDLTDNFWEKYLRNLPKYVVLENKYWFESRNIGGGAPPIETEHGWLVIFHANSELNKGQIYHAGAALLDKKNPGKVIGRLNYPLFSADRDWEKQNPTRRVVFPTGTAIFGDDLYIYYGAADRCVAAAKVSFSALLAELKRSAGS